MMVFVIGYVSSYVFMPVHTEYSSYKFAMFFVKIFPWFIIPFVLQDKVRNFLYGIWICLFIQLAVASMFALKSIHEVSISNRLDIGNVSSIWINRSMFELFLLSYCLRICFNKKICLLLIFMSLLITYTTGSKGGVISFLLVLCLNYLNNVSFRQKVIMILLVLSSIITLFILLPKDGYIFQRFFSAVPENTSVENFEESRVVVWPESINKILNEDFESLIFGNGIGSFPVFYYGYNYDSRSYPHNIVLEILIENGLLFLLVILYILWKILRKSKSPLFLLFYYYLLNAAFSGDLLLNEYVFLYLFLSIVHNKYYTNESLIFNC